MARTFKHLTWDKRIEIASYLKLNLSVIEISKLVGVHRSTIYRELKNGVYEHTNKDLTKVERYSPDIAQDKYILNMQSKGKAIKLGKDREYAEFLEMMVIENKYSPQATLAYISNNKLIFNTQISIGTFYSYIDKGIFLNLTNEHLPEKKNRKRTYRKIQRRSKFLGKSIEHRPKVIDTRLDFGHWEMDCVLGGLKKNKVLLVLTERKTRQEIVRIIDEKKASFVVDALDDIERSFGKENFRKIFKTITVDNGSEFADSKGLETSVYDAGETRTEVYFCHPYSSWERGSNENANKLIRRHLPKGMDFTEVNKEQVEYIEDWINTYPRKLLSWRCSNDLYKFELKKLKLTA